MKRYLVALLCFFTFSVFGVEGIYLGAQLGHVALSGKAAIHNNALGISGDLGVRTNSWLDVVFHFGYSSHSGGGDLTLMHPTLSADFHLYQMNDIDVSAGLGPGVYLFKVGTVNESDFGLNFGVNGDVVVSEAVHLGIGWRWHQVFGGNLGDRFWTVTARVGYFFASF